MSGSASASTAAAPSGAAGQRNADRNAIRTRMVPLRNKAKKRSAPSSFFQAGERSHPCRRDLHKLRQAATVQVCLGLRVSELLALRWQDVNWMGRSLNVEHGMNQHLDSVKTEESRKIMTLDSRLLAVLSGWRQQSQFRGAEDCPFPSPAKLGRLPYSYTGYLRVCRSGRRLRDSAGWARTRSVTRTARGWTQSERPSQCSSGLCGTVTSKLR
jgi:integrase